MISVWGVDHGVVSKALRPHHVAYGATAGMGAIAAGNAMAPRRVEQHGDYDYVTRRQFSPISMAEPGGRSIPVPLPSSGMGTNVYRDREHVGFVDSQQTLWNPRERKVINAYTAPEHRGRGIATNAVRQNLSGASRTGASTNRSPDGNRLATRIGAAPVDTKPNISSTMDQNWAFHRSDRSERRMARDRNLIGRI